MVLKNKNKDIEVLINKILALIEKSHKKTEKKIIDEFIKGKRCLGCGEYKTADHSNSTDYCEKCLENN